MDRQLHHDSRNRQPVIKAVAASGLPHPQRRTRRRRLAALVCGCVTTLATVGCGLTQRIPDGPYDTKTSYHDHSAMRIEYPEVRQCATPTSNAAAAATQPNSLQDPATLPAIELTLRDAIQQALRSSPVLRSIGGAVVTSPQAVATVFDPALAHANPQLGVEAALSAFDAQYTQSLFWDKVDQPRNLDPAAFGGGGGGGVGNLFPAFSQQQLASFSNDITKRTATGASFSLRNNVQYARTQDPSRQTQLFPSAFTGFMEAEYRQPMMRGAGTTFNRIAGTSGIVGQYNGVLIARVNEDVALADFEAAVIALIADVEQAYWDLTASYRVLEAVAKGREAALQTFQYQQVRLEVGTGRRDEEAQARSQYYQFEAQVQSALAGQTGLYEVEQRLRYLIGMPASDGSILKPTTSPIDAKVVFDWDSALGQALVRRVEVRRQKFNVKRREMELVAARLNRRPQADFVGQYRWRGLGDNLIGPSDALVSDSLIADITGGNYQEWRAGVELSAPIGLRAASSAVAHAQLNLQRDRALLSETELRVSHDLAASARAIDLTYQLVETNYNRYLADLRQVDVLRRRYRDGTDNINFLLQAQRQVVTSEVEFYRSISNYNLAIRDFHRQKGSLLAYAEVNLAEGSWCPGAERDAYELGRFLEPRSQPEKVGVPCPITSGPFDPSATQPTISVATRSMGGLNMIDEQSTTPSEVIVAPDIPEAPEE